MDLIYTSALSKDNLEKLLINNTYDKRKLKDLFSRNLNINPNLFYSATTIEIFEDALNGEWIHEFENKKKWGCFSQSGKIISNKDLKDKYIRCFPLIAGKFGLNLIEGAKENPEVLRILAWSENSFLSSTEYKHIAGVAFTPPIVKIEFVLGVEDFQIQDSNTYSIRYKDLSSLYLK